MALNSLTPTFFPLQRQPYCIVAIGFFVLGTIVGEGTVWAEAQNPVFVAETHLSPLNAHYFLFRGLKNWLIDVL